MNICKSVIYIILLSCSYLSAAEFTISTYNCGGLSDHYDYLRAACMQKIMQERYSAEPENLALLQKIQTVALRLLFSPDNEERLAAQIEWNIKNYHKIANNSTSSPDQSDSPNASWNQKVDAMITSYRVRPVTISDLEVNELIQSHIHDSNLTKAREIMAKRIFTHHMKFDIICLQEADYLDSSMFPEKYEVLFSSRAHSVNGVTSWNKDRFEIKSPPGNVQDSAFVVELLDKETGKTLLVASGHLTGCNPYQPVQNDSAKGDSQIKQLIDTMNNYDSDLKIIGMDSNVTSLHPRLAILKNAGYELDFEHFLEPTCSSPYQVLDTRIDWIFLKDQTNSATIVNIPVLSVGLNNIVNNISDHKPIAAKIHY